MTNEANITGSASTSDGYFPGAEAALVQGVIAAKQASTAAGQHIRIGFNWSYQLDMTEPAFWSYLKTAGGAAFRAALDWVGLDVYPGTRGPALPTGVSLGTAVSGQMGAALQTLRGVEMPLAGIPASVPIHVSETGYPTGPGRSDADQTAALTAEVQTVNSLRATYGVSDFRWFDLRDAISSSGNDNDQYGLMTDAYVPKPAFAQYRQLIAQLTTGS